MHRDVFSHSKLSSTLTSIDLLLGTFIILYNIVYMCTAEKRRK